MTEASIGKDLKSHSSSEDKQQNEPEIGDEVSLILNNFGVAS